MGLPKLKDKALFWAKILYGLLTVLIFGFISLYWLLGMIFTPFILHEFVTQPKFELLMPLGLVAFGGFALISLARLNYQVLSNKINISEIKTTLNIGIIIGCTICLWATYLSVITLMPMALVAILYYFAYLNPIKQKTSPTSQTPQPQEQA